MGAAASAPDAPRGPGGGGAPPPPVASPSSAASSAPSSVSAAARSPPRGDGGSDRPPPVAAGAGASSPRPPQPPPAPQPAPSSSPSAALSAVSADDSVAPHMARDLPHHILECQLLPGSGRAMRSYRVRHADSGALLVVRAAVLKYGPDDEGEVLEDVAARAAELGRIRDAVGDPRTHPNVLPFLAWSASDPLRDYRSGVTAQAMYLARGHVHSTLSERLATRPFLAPIEKNWIAYQVLRAMSSLHEAGVCHGHLTCENVGITSWGWAVITDVASYKPVTIPGDDPSDLIAHYQERGGAGGQRSGLGRGGHHGERQRCYLAPERFTAAGGPAAASSGLTPAMDIFSAGCVLVEMYLNGERALDLGELMECRRAASAGESDAGAAVPSLRQRLGKIESSSVRAACRHMLSLDPARRLSGAEYLERLSAGPGPARAGGGARDGGAAAAGGTASSPAAPIPPCFDSVLFPLLKRLRCENLSPDARVALAALHYGRVVKETVGISDGWGERYFQRIVGPTMIELELKELRDLSDQKGASTPSGVQEQAPADPTLAEGLGRSLSNNAETESGDALLAETEELLRRLEASAFFLDSPVTPPKSEPEVSPSPKDDEGEQSSHEPPKLKDDLKLLFREASAKWGASPPPSASALVVFVQLVLSSIRHVQHPSSKLVALRLLLRLGQLSTDEVRLQRIVPSVASLLNDTDAAVRALAVAALADALSAIRSFPPSDAQLFPQYVFKRMGHLVSDPSPAVRVSFAEHLPLLAETARRFLDLSHAVRLYESVGAADGGGGGKKGKGGAAGGEKGKGGSNSEPPTPRGGQGAVPEFSDDLFNLLGEDKTQTEAAVAGALHKGSDAGHERRHSGGAASIGTSVATDPAAPGAGGAAAVTTLIENTYDADLASLHETVSRWVVHIATDTESDSSSPPKAALLPDLPRLCNFFGHDGVMTFVLPQILAFLNDRHDWRLRAELCLRLPSACAVVGRAATEQFVVPCVETALVDEEEHVIACALLCLASLAEMGLIARATLLGPYDGPSSEGGGVGIVEKCAPLVIHPSSDVRCGTISLFCAACKSVGFPDDEVFILPLLRPFLRYEPLQDQLRSEKGIMSCLVPPLTRRELRDEFERIREAAVTGQSSPQWTSVAGPTSAKTKGDEERVGTSLHGAERPVGVYAAKETALGTGLMQRYLQMLYRRNRFGNPFDVQSDPKLETVSTAGGASKFVYSCNVPNQKFAELVKHSLPQWYDVLRQVSDESSNQFCAESCALRSLSSLNRVYGLTVSQPTNSFEPKRSWKGDPAYAYSDIMLDDNIPLDTDGGLSKDNAVSFLSSDESKTFEATVKGEWGSCLRLDPALAENSLHATKLEAMGVPPLPPRLGLLREQDGRPFSWHGPLASTTDNAAEALPRTEWRPKVDALVASSSPASEHSGAVTRLAVSQDQAFFVSASHDGTSRVWELRQTQESVGDLRSCLTYSGHLSNQGARINDVSIIENSHSVATAASNGSVHVWRVDMVSSKGSVFGSNQAEASKSEPESLSNKYYERSRVSGSVLIRDINPCEGEVLSVSHFNTEFSSIVMFGTQKGRIHSWDLRCAKEPFALDLRPELGYLTSMAVGHDRNWAVAGTNQGFVCLWDLRFQKMVKLWQHSSTAPISRLAASFTILPQDKDASSASPFIFVGSGLNEASAFDILEGKCRQCFRVLDPELCYVDQSALPPSCLSMPDLQELPIPSHSWSRIYSSNEGIIGRVKRSRFCTPEPSILSLIGRIGIGGQNFLITGGSDCYIRYWDFSTPSRCYTVSGFINSQPRPVYENVDVGRLSKLFLCRQMPVPRLSEVENGKIPRKLQRGAVRPDVYCHRDAILDLKMVDIPMKGLLSCSRDGVIKMWR